MKYQIVAGDRIINGVGDHSQTTKLVQRAEALNLSVTHLEIVNLAKRWEDKLLPHQFKSGAAVMAALKKARKLLETRKAHVVVIQGEDNLRTGYAKGEREKFMKLYNGRYTPLEGYTKLVPLFMKKNGLSEGEFKKLAEELFQNYLQTYRRANPKSPLPDERWFQFITRYFRGVDCANPNIDYSGRIVVTSAKTADRLKVPQKKRVTILGNEFTKLKVDGLESLPQVSTYDHLKKVSTKAQRESAIDFKQEFLKGRALMDAYTCYPVVPLALLFKLGFVKDHSELSSFLKAHEVTVTGGLNLAKAPWNLTSLNGIIEMREKLLNSKKFRYGLVHGNGSLGNQQGITIIGV
jgi:hypothetical protein